MVQRLPGLWPIKPEAPCLWSLLSFLLKETEGRRRCCDHVVRPQHSPLAVILSQPFPLGTEHEMQRASLSYDTVTHPPSISPSGVSLVTLAAVVLSKIPGAAI